MEPIKHGKQKKEKEIIPDLILLSIYIFFIIIIICRSIRLTKKKSILLGYSHHNLFNIDDLDYLYIYIFEKQHKIFLNS